MSYDAYEHFLKAVEKFPRWTNMRRRPQESNAGRILRSIVEEIATIEDAILAYKRDFFLKNYIDRPDEIIDYVYSAQVGDISDISLLKILDPEAYVTDDEAVFYEDEKAAYYQDTYLILHETNKDNLLKYSYNESLPYQIEITPLSVWNIFDEFAWWCGLERFEGERNASLMQRCFYQFRRKPNSTKEGIRNVILNTAYAGQDILPEEERETFRELEADEVKFLDVNETTMALLNDDGDSLYEEVSQFNRDIARTRQWDIDYWDNGFRELKYLPHVWDAEVDIYQNGVGYHDALQVATVREVDQDNTTDVIINGYVQSLEEVEAYIRDYNVRQNISLSLERYSDVLEPLRVDYKVTAEDLVPVGDLHDIKFSFYKKYPAVAEYYIEDFVKKPSDGVMARRSNTLLANTGYRVIFTGQESTGQMRIDYCRTVTEGQEPVSVLVTKPSQDFIFDGDAIINNAVKLHATRVIDLIDANNLIDSTEENGGIKLNKPLLNASFKIPLHDWASPVGQPLKISINENTGWNNIANHPLIKMDRFTYDKNNRRYISAANDVLTDKLVIDLDENRCRQIKFRISSVNNSPDAKVNIVVTTTDGKVLRSRKQTYVKNGIDFSFENPDTDQPIKIEITRFTTPPIIVSDIMLQSYDIQLDVVHNGAVVERIPYSVHEPMQISPSVPEGSVLECTIRNNGNPESPVINYIHIGPDLSLKTYELDIPAADHERVLELSANCNAALFRINANGTMSRIGNFDPHYTYSDNGNGNAYLILDLSNFDTIAYTEPAVQRRVFDGENAYYLPLSNGQSIQKIRISGKGSKLDRIKSLSDIIQLKNNEKLYYAHSFHGFIKKTPEGLEEFSIPRSDIAYGDCVKISYLNTNTVKGRFFISKEAGLFRDTNEYEGIYESVCLFEDSAKQYIIHTHENFYRNITDYIPIPTGFNPSPGTNANLIYRVELPYRQDGVEIYFHKDETGSRDWTISGSSETITVEIADYKNLDKTNLFHSSVSGLAQNRTLSNIVSLDEMVKQSGQNLDLGCYIITPPDDMEVVYVETSYSQDQYEDGFPLYVKEDGFNKLYYSNIISISRIVIDGVTYTNTTATKIEDILTLRQKEGIICWKTGTDLTGKFIQQVDYKYMKPVSLRYKKLSDMYKKSGYKMKAVDIIGSYTVEDVEEGSTIDIDYSQFQVDGEQMEPALIVARCTNPCYYAFVSDGAIHISKIGEDTTPVVHNGYYYMDGKEYWFFSNRYSREADKFDGVKLENSSVIENNLYMYQRAENHLLNSRMDRNKLDYHCIVNFHEPSVPTNTDPGGVIGACESYSAWEGYHTYRALTTYKNGYAIKFTIPDHGYSILDITQFIADFKTVSCLFTGDLTFQLGKEIYIMGQPARKTVYCEPVADFTVYNDVAYCIAEDIAPLEYRYYLIVRGNGTLDEILFHDFTDPEEIADRHIKAIDRLGFRVTEKNKAAEQIVTVPYSADFIKYNQLETDRDNMMRVGTTVDWNITRMQEFDLSTCKKTQFLLRGGRLIAQADGARLETNPVEISYRNSIHRMALKVNRLIDDIWKNVSIYVYSCGTENGTYQELIHVTQKNVVEFNIKEKDRFLKFVIVAREYAMIDDIELFAIYRESGQESLGIFYQTEGSAVTKVFNIGAAANYRLSSVICTEGYDRYDSIFIRGARQTDTGELVWTEWKDTADHPEFYDYELFQFKITMIGQDARLQIQAFEFEVF